MNAQELINWLEEILAVGIPMDSDDRYDRYAAQAASRWLTDADAALKSAFPPHHPISGRWKATTDPTPRPTGWHTSHRHVVESARGIVESALGLLKAGRLSSVVEGIRAETVTDLLDQADYLADQKYIVAATVVAGGALETFLHFKCIANDLSWGDGHGAIGKYKDALAQARKGGNEIITLADEKQVTAWGDLRNTAAHKPAEFNRSVDEVRLMVAGIRQIVSKYGS